MNPEHERAALQAALDYLSLSPAEAAEWAPRLDEPRLLEMRAAAGRCLRARLHELETVPTKEYQALEVYLAVTAQPQVDKARDEIIARLSGSRNLVSEMLDLAQRDSDMAGVLANGTWAESFMRGQGTDVREAVQAAQTLRSVAANAAAQSADSTRRAAGVQVPPDAG